MQSKRILISVFAIAFIGSIWLNYLKQEVEKPQVDMVENLAAEPTTEQNYAHVVPEPLTSEMYESDSGADFEDDFDNEFESDIVTATLQEPEIFDDEENIVNTPTLFEGNSDYTGDDTEDNDAGNAGFEDDHPEAKFAYDDHFAEGYSNYTESYSDE